jgi:hypothetical protein
MIEEEAELIRLAVDLDGGEAGALDDDEEVVWLGGGREGEEHGDCFGPGLEEELVDGEADRVPASDRSGQREGGLEGVGVEAVYALEGD